MYGCGSVEQRFCWILGGYWSPEALVDRNMVSAPPPRLWGDLTIFFLFMLGGHFKFFLTLGGPNLMGGSLDMMGGMPIFRFEKHFPTISSTAGLLHNIAIIEQCRILCDETHTTIAKVHYSQVKV